MRNLKKILALVLALVMALSVMATAAFTDAAEIDATYDEATQVLAALKVFEGKGNNEFDPKANITREEVAAIMYRIATGDVDKKQVSLYVDGAKFDDVASTSWAAGYIGYCANGGIIGGYGDGNFGFGDSVTGYQVLAMILRAIGYGKNGEFQGAGWEKNVASVAQDAGILKNLKNVQLSLPVSREVVAELLFQGILVPQVVYTPAFGYQLATGLLGTTETIGQEVFKLYPELNTQDTWGRPGKTWHFNTTGTLFIAEKATAKYLTAVTDCQVAADTKQVTRDVTYTTYLNGKNYSATDVITSTDTVGTIGKQGRLTEVYAAAGKIVYIDTLLAEVTAVAPAVFDAAGHRISESSITLKIFDADCTDKDATTSVPFSTVTLYNGSTNYTYAKGDIVLVNATQSWNGKIDRATVVINGKATALTGVQTTLWFEADQHTVNGTIYNDNNRFHLDEAGYDYTNHTWYFDANGNLIGVIDIDAVYSYGVLSSLYWVNDGSNYGAGAAYGVITYMDGTNSGVVEIDSVDGETTTYARYGDTVGADYSVNGKFGVSTYALDNASLLLTELYKIQTKTDGSLVLTKLDKTAGTNSTITKGVSKVTNETLYGDNFTQYLIYNPVTKTFAAVTGYANIDTYADIDFCYENGTTFLKKVFIVGTPASATAADFAFVTNAGANFTLSTIAADVQLINITGIVRADGTTTPIIVKADAEGTTAQTLTKLQSKFADSVGKLFEVTTVGGYVADVDAILEVDGDLASADDNTNGSTIALYEGTPSDYTENGVLVVDGVYYNVNTTTTIVTKAGKGTTADLTAAVVAGKQVYVVYTAPYTTTATAIFVTDYNAAVVALAAAKVEAVEALKAFAADVVTTDGWGDTPDVVAADLEATVIAETAKINAATSTTAVTAALNAGKDAVWAKAEAKQDEYDAADTLSDAKTAAKTALTTFAGTLVAAPVTADDLAATLAAAKDAVDAATTTAKVTEAQTAGEAALTKKANETKVEAVEVDADMNITIDPATSADVAAEVLAEIVDVTGVTEAAVITGTYVAPTTAGNSAAATVKVTLTAGEAIRVEIVNVTVTLG